MSSFSVHKQFTKTSAVIKPYHQEIDKAPRQFIDYMNGICGRFTEICQIYLDGLSMDDIRYLTAEDLINLVPENQFRHRLLMTIMVRRYLFRPDDCETVYCHPEKSDVYESIRCDDTSSSGSVFSECIDIPHRERSVGGNNIVYACKKCTHTCSKPVCNHSCDDYKKIEIKFP